MGKLQRDLPFALRGDEGRDGDRLVVKVAPGRANVADGLRVQANLRAMDHGVRQGFGRDAVGGTWSALALVRGARL